MSADEEVPDTGRPSGPDLVRKALAEAKAAARERGTAVGGARSTRKAGPVRRRTPAGDPVRFGEAIQRLVDERGWQDTTTAAGVLANWAAVVGPEIADHCQPVSLLDGELVIVAESTAWATQLRLLTTTLLARVREHAGDGVASKVVVRGPAQPDWRKGPRRVRGRGPRDTYG
ncbi:MAG TPA: DciA family protein [Mycobacteriales bacterium]|nr:DciA family protein [Mycobacteriales bacterium]